MESFIFSVNAVMPLVTLVTLGYVLRRVKLISRDFAAAATGLCFRIFLPVMLFVNIYAAESLNEINMGLTLYAVAGILLSFAFGYLCQRLFIKDAKQKGVVWQTAYRTNFAILGMPLAISLFGYAGGRASAVLTIFTIPLFTILSVVSLRSFPDDKTTEITKSTKILFVFKEIIRNPMMIAVFFGFGVLVVRMYFENVGIGFRLTDIGFAFSALRSVSAVTTPLALIAMGAQFNFTAAKGYIRPLAASIALRNVIMPAILLFAAFLFFPGFYGAGFAALIALFAAPVAVAGTVMAIEMGGDAELARQILFWSTLLSALTIFLFVFLFSYLGALV